MKRILFFLATLLLASAPMAQAQSWAAGAGLRVGGSAALLRGNNVGITDDATDRQYGFTVGVYKAFPLGSGFALQPELLYTQKGGKLDVSDFDPQTSGDITFNVDYLELPVTVAYTVPTRGRIVPMLYAGPYASLATRRNAEIDFEGGSFSIDGDETFKTLDYGAVFGADLGVKLRRQMVTLGVRYDLGIADIVKDEVASEDDEFAVANDVRTDEWSIVAGVRF